MEEEKEIIKRTNLGTAWATIVVLFSILIFLLPVIRSQGPAVWLIHWWSDEPTTVGSFLYDDWSDVSAGNTIGRDGGAIYEVASIASYTVVAILTILSFTGPLLLLYFNQVVDGIQSLLDTVFNCVKSCKETGGKVPQVLDDICIDTFRVLGDAQKVGALLKPVFNTIVAIAVLLLVSSLLVQALLVRSVFLYVFMTRTFNVSVFLGINSIIAVWILARERYASDRIMLLRRMDRYLRADLANSLGKEACNRRVLPDNVVPTSEVRNILERSSLRKETQEKTWLKAFLILSVGSVWVYRLFTRGQRGQREKTSEVNSSNERNK